MKISVKQLHNIAQTYYDDIYKYCLRRVNNCDDAFDLTQEVFLALNMYYKTIDYKKVRQWLYSTAHNIVVDYYKSKKKYVENVISLDSLCESTIPAPDQPTLSSEDDIDRCKSDIISTLSKNEQELYEDVYIRKISYAKLAIMYNISEAALRKRISRLHKKIITKIKSMLY